MKIYRQIKISQINLKGPREHNILESVTDKLWIDESPEQLNESNMLGLINQHDSCTDTNVKLFEVTKINYDVATIKAI